MGSDDFLAQYLPTFPISFFFFWPNVLWKRQWEHRALITEPSRTSLHRTTQSTGFSRPEYWSGWPFPSPGDLPDPGLEPGLPHCRRILYQLSHKGSPILFNAVLYSTANIKTLPRLFNHLPLTREVAVSVLLAVITSQWTWTWMSSHGKSTHGAERAKARGRHSAPSLLLAGWSLRSSCYSGSQFCQRWSRCFSEPCWLTWNERHLPSTERRTAQMLTRPLPSSWILTRECSVVPRAPPPVCVHWIRSPWRAFAGFFLLTSGPPVLAFSHQPGSMSSSPTHPCRYVHTYVHRHTRLKSNLK